MSAPASAPPHDSWPRLLTRADTRDAIEHACFKTLTWRDDTDAAKARVAQLRASGLTAVFEVASTHN